VEVVINGLDVLVCTSFSESFGLVLVEALACGVPVVSTDFMLSRKIIGSSYTVSPGEAETFADKVYSLLVASPTERKAIGQYGREQLMQDYDKTTMIRHYCSLYRWLRAVPRDQCSSSQAQS